MSTAVEHRIAKITAALDRITPRPTEYDRIIAAPRRSIG
jgi:hypothetical protein